MPPIPAEVLPILIALGIIDPASSTWKKKEPWPIRRMRAHFFCECAKPGERVELVAARLRSRPVFIGQCTKCRTIYWRQAVADN